MSARPLFWSASRAAARRRVSRRGFFVVAGVHLAALAGVVLLSAGPAKVSVAAGRKAPPAGAAEPVVAPEDKEPPVVWIDPAAFEAPLPPAAEPPSPVEEEATAVPPEPSPLVPSPPRPPAVREPFLTPPTPRPVRPPRPKPKPSAAVVPPPRKAPPLPTVRIRAVAARPGLSPVHPRPTQKPPAATATSNPAGRSGSGAAAESPGGGDAAGEDNGGADNNGPAGAGGTDWYASMLHERFYARWEQPTSVFASAQRYVATLRLRIERDGRISDYRLVRPSGLVPMDESVLAAAARVGRVDPPPSGLMRGGVYVVNVGFVRE